MDADGNELECRVCRSGPEDGRQLFFPCMCSGSIGAVHQDCLEAWLDHSKKDTCELCTTKYRFEPHYADGTPTVIPLGVFTKTVLKLSIFRVFPAILRILFAFLIWVLIVPILTSTIYCMCVGRPISLTFNDWSLVKAQIVHGFTIDAVIALSLLILISFTDFLRFHLVPAQEAGAAPPGDIPVPAGAAAVANGGLGAAVPVEVAANQDAPIVPAPQPAVQPANNNTNNNINNDTNDHHNPAYQLRRRHRDRRHRHTPEDVPSPRSPGRRDMTAAARSSGIYSRGDNPLYREHFSANVPGTPGGATNRSVMDNAQRGLWKHPPSDDSSEEEESSLLRGRRTTHYVQHHLADDWGNEDDRESSSSDSDDDTESESDHDWRQERDRQAEFQFNFDLPNHNHDDDHENVQNFDEMHQDPVQDNIQDNIQGNMPEQPQDFDNLDLNDNLEGLQEANVEVRLAIFEILGVEGPFHLMFRNSFWLLGFCALYLFFTAMVPYMIGSMLAKLSVVYLQAHAASLVPVAVKTMYDLIVQFSTDAVPLQFLDFFYIFGGCCGIFTAVFVLDCAAFLLLSSLKVPQAIKVVLELINKLAVVIKVGCLLLVRIFLLPLTLGTAVLVVSSHTLLPYTATQWAHFIALHCLGAFAVAWVAGITFMLTMTISVLQLREVLHPALLGKVIRPQEPHVDLINSLIQESGLVHIRRIFISLFVYLLLMLLLLYVPMLQYTALCRLAQRSHFFTFTYWYVIPEIQIPLELMVSHLTFLSLLDKHKDVIGRLQHVILVVLCEKLGVTRFVLPCPQLQLRRQASTSSTATVTNGNVAQPAVENAGAVAETPGTPGAGQEVRVGAPLRRPPPGWDIRTPNQSTRWAWGTEEPSIVERTVAPRVTPSLWLLRVAVLVCVCFLLLNGIALFFLLVPLQLGRALTALVYVPQVFRHDPLHFVIGCIACMIGGSGIYERLPRWERVKEFATAIRSLPLNVIYQVILVCGQLAVAHVLLAVVLHTLVCTPSLANLARAAMGTLSGEDGAVAVMNVVNGVSGVGADIVIAADAAIVAAARTEVVAEDLNAAYLHSLAASVNAWAHASSSALLQALLVSVVASFTARQVLTSNAAIDYLGALAAEQPDSTLAALYRWAAALKQIPFEVSLALNSRIYTVESLKLRQIQDSLLLPLIRELFLQCILVAVAITAGLCWLDSRYRLNPQFVFSQFQLGVYFYVLRQVCVLLYHPLRGVAEAVHKQVLNDNYLIGRTLVNNSVVQSREAEAAAATVTT